MPPFTKARRKRQYRSSGTVADLLQSLLEHEESIPLDAELLRAAKPLERALDDGEWRSPNQTEIAPAVD